MTPTPDGIWSRIPKGSKEIRVPSSTTRHRIRLSLPHSASETDTLTLMPGATRSGVADPLGLGTWSSFSVGGSLGPITFKWTSDKPPSTQNEFVTDFELGGGISFCYTPDSPCHGERPRLPFNFNVGIGRWTGISTEGERLCINVGSSASFLPIDISISFFDAPPFGSPPSAWGAIAWPPLPQSSRFLVQVAWRRSSFEPRFRYSGASSRRNSTRSSTEPTSGWR